jgi:hypothetical protein
VEDVDEEVVAEEVKVGGSGVEAAELPVVVLVVDEGDGMRHDDEVFCALKGQGINFEAGSDGVGEGGGTGVRIVEGEDP